MTAGHSGADLARPGVAAGPMAPPLATVPRLCVALHDVAPARWQACLRVPAQLHLVAGQAGVPLPVSLLLVPRTRGHLDTHAR